MSFDNVSLIDNAANHRFELRVDHQVGFIDYQCRSGKMYLLHTEVPKRLEGKGVAAALVEKALRLIQTRGLELVPRCAFVIQYLNRHPEWKHLSKPSPKQKND